MLSTRLVVRHSSRTRRRYSKKDDIFSFLKTSKVAPSKNPLPDQNLTPKPDDNKGNLVKEHWLDFLKNPPVSKSPELDLGSLFSKSDRPPLKENENPLSGFMATMDKQKNVASEPKEKTAQSALLTSLLESFQMRQEEKKETVNKEEYKALDDIFAAKARSLNELVYWLVYPKQIKKWIVFTKTPKGYYDEFGKWVVTSDLPEPETLPESKEALDRWEALYAEEQRRLPAALRGNFRFGIQHSEIKDYHPKIRRLFSFTFATHKEVQKFYKQTAIIKWKQHETDTASDAIQIDILTLRIRSMIDHLQKNKQDMHNKRNLQLMVKRRRGIMLHLKARNVPLYYEVLREIKLRDMYELFKQRHFHK